MSTTNPQLFREDLVVGNLYYIDEKLKRKNSFSDSIIVWKSGPNLDPTQGHKDKHVDKIWMNVHNPFVVLSIEADPEIPSTYWYYVLTKQGNVGWFALDDEDIKLLYLCFREAEIPSSE